MAQGANIKVELDTKPAKKKLQQLGKEGEATARRVGGGKESGSGGFGGGLAQGFGVGAGFGLGKKIAGAVGVFSATGDVIGEAFSGVTAMVDSEIGAPAARAKMAARNETVANYAFAAGVTGSTADAKEYFNNILKAKHMPLEQGAADIRAATGGTKGSEMNISRNPLDHVFDGIVSQIESGFEGIIRAVKGGG